MTVIRKFTVNEERLTDLVHLMRRNFPPDLYLREFLKNNIQAIQRAEGKGYLYSRAGCARLSVVATAPTLVNSHPM